MTTLRRWEACGFLNLRFTICYVADEMQLQSSALEVPDVKSMQPLAYSVFTLIYIQRSELCKGPPVPQKMAFSLSQDSSFKCSVLQTEVL